MLAKTGGYLKKRAPRCARCRLPTREDVVICPVCARELEKVLSPPAEDVAVPQSVSNATHKAFLAGIRPSQERHH
jgi:predicted amidophosphoribosyltransferase